MACPQTKHFKNDITQIGSAEFRIQLVYKRIDFRFCIINLGHTYDVGNHGYPRFGMRIRMIIT